eukprot:827664_1
MSLEKSLANINLKHYSDDSPEMTPSIYELATNNRHNNVDKQPLNINNEIEIEINENNIDSDDNELLYENDINNKREFKLFGNQVAGTLPMLHSNGKLYKPLKT